MSRRPKVWKTEDQILAAIDLTKRLAERRLKQSKKLDEDAKVKFGKCEKTRFELMSIPQGMKHDSLAARLAGEELSAGATKERADIAAKSYHRAINSTLPRLGEILSAMRTRTFKEVVGEYKGVAVR